MALSTTYLLATDGSKPAREAEDYISRTADPKRVEIIVLGVCDPAIILGGYEFSSERTEILDTERLLEEMNLKTRNQVSACEERLRENDFEVQTEVVQGSPGEEIISMADKQNVDSIVLGRSGAGAVTEVLLGSVSSYVVHHTERPVILVPDSE